MSSSTGAVPLNDATVPFMLLKFGIVIKLGNHATSHHGGQFKNREFCVLLDVNSSCTKVLIDKTQELHMFQIVVVYHA